MRIRLNQAERWHVFTHLAAMERAGLPVERCYASMPLPRRAEKGRAALLRGLRNGRDLVSAARASGLFRVEELRLLRAGVETGDLSSIYRRLSERLGARVAMARAIRARLMLPGLVFLLAMLIQPLPALVRGDVTPFDVIVVVLRNLLLVAVAWGGVRALISGVLRPVEGGRSRVLDHLLLRVPLFGPLHAKCNARDFSESLGDLLMAGVPMFEALPIARATLSNAVVHARAVTLEHAVRQGEPFASACRGLSLPAFGPMCELAHAGEHAGRLAESLLDHARLAQTGIAHTTGELAVWFPRLIYAALVVWLASGLLGGVGMPPPPH